MRTATIEDQNLVVKILTESFFDNKSVLFVVNNDKRRIPLLMKYSFKKGLNEGEVWINEENSAVIIALYPHQSSLNFESLILDLKLLVQVIGVTRVFKILSRENRIKAKQPKTNFVHLWYIGVAKAHQGMGKGSKLLKQFIESQKNSGRPVYLETSTARNLNFYLKNGFKRIDEIKKGLPYTLIMFMRQST